MAKNKLKITRLPDYIKKQHNSPEAVAEFLPYLRDALAELSHSSSGSRGSSSATAHAGLILQALAWLCRAQVHVPDRDVLTRLHALCSKALRALEPALQQGALNLDQLRPLLQPCPEDGATPGGCFTEQFAAVLLPHTQHCIHKSHPCYPCKQHLAIGELTTSPSTAYAAAVSPGAPAGSVSCAVPSTQYLLLHGCTATSVHACTAPAEIVYCFGLWASWLAVTCDAPEDEPEQITWWKQAGSLQLAWYQLYSIARLYSSSRTGPRGVWLHRPLLRLLGRLVGKALKTEGPVGPVMSVHGLTVVRLGMLVAAARPSSHPGLQRWLPASMSPQQLEVSSANVEGMIKQQVRLRLTLGHVIAGMVQGEACTGVCCEAGRKLAALYCCIQSIRTLCLTCLSTVSATFVHATRKTC